MLNWFYTFLGVIWLLFSPLSLANSQVIIGLQNEWPPYVIDGNPPTGLSVDIVKAAYATQGYDIQIEIKPWSRSLKEAEYGRDVVVIAAWYSDTRKDTLLFSDPYLYNEISLVTLKDNQFEWGTYKDLNGKTVGVIKSYAYDDDFLQSPWLMRIEASDLLTNIHKVMNGRIDMFIEEYRVALWTMRKNKIPPNLFTKIYPNVAYSGLYVASGKANPKAKVYIEAFNRGLRLIRSNGELDRIVKKYDNE
ncbi:substrate-binding periplasmic protein [Vibrio tritonius]|uniref:substrate-binding periplasmic protein n=1 Tax=Vibrio tritonius TaxID=1435069 RepID=UPI00315CB1A7